MLDDVGVCICAREAMPASFLAAALQLTRWSLCNVDGWLGEKQTPV